MLTWRRFSKKIQNIANNNNAMIQKMELSKQSISLQQLM